MLLGSLWGVRFARKCAMQHKKPNGRFRETKGNGALYSDAITRSGVYECVVPALERARACDKRSNCASAFFVRSALDNLSNASECDRFKERFLRKLEHD